MATNANLVDKAAMIGTEFRRLRQAPPEAITAEHLITLAEAVEALALYVAQRDGIRLTQP